MAASAMAEMALVSNCTTTSTDVEERWDTSAISSLVLATIGRMALVFNCTTTSADVEERLDTSAIQPMAASARGDMVGARGELLGARGGCGPDLHCSQGHCGYWRSLVPGLDKDDSVGHQNT